MKTTKILKKMHLVNTEKKESENVAFLFQHHSLCLGTKSNTSVCACLCVLVGVRALAMKEREKRNPNRFF
jgi:hypothetical protein